MVEKLWQSCEVPEEWDKQMSLLSSEEQEGRSGELQEGQSLMSPWGVDRETNSGNHNQPETWKTRM